MMASPNNAPQTSHECGPDTTVLDRYFTESAKEPEVRYQTALSVWDSLAPKARLELQAASRKLSGGNLALGALYTQSVLLLEYANRQAEKDAEVNSLALLVTPFESGNL